MKPQIFKTAILAMSLVTVLSACTETITEKIKYVPVEKGQSVDKNGRVILDINGKMAVDDLINVGEQLIGPYTFHLADRAFEMVLQKDPDNKKAQFYRAFLKRFMVTKGIYTRVKPYARRLMRITQHEKDIKSIPNHPLKTFLLDGKEDIESIGDMQNFLAEYRKANEAFRNFLFLNPDLDMDFYMNPSVFSQQIKENEANSCVVSYTDEGAKVDCDTTDIATIKINPADLLVLRQEAAGQILYFSLLTSHSLAGTDHVWKELEMSQRSVCTEHLSQFLSHTDTNGNPVYYNYPTYVCQQVGKSIPPSDVLKALEGIPAFGKLKKDHAFGLIRGLGADLSAAAKWVMKQQEKLCPHGVEFANSRKGKLFSSGICVNMSETERDIALLDEALRGPILAKHHVVGRDVEIKADYFAYFANPVQDLRQLFPATYDNCGNGTTLKDGTFGGMFPNGDADKLLETSNCRK